MPRKKSVKGAADKFVSRAESLERYYRDVLDSELGEQAVTWACEAAVIKLSVYFEHLMLHSLVGAINNDTSTVSERTGIAFPKHLTDEVCEYIVTGGRYFDFRGRDGLIRLLRQYVPEDHYLVETVTQQKYRVTLERLIALRNLAAHESSIGKRIAKEAVAPSIAVAGVWLKRNDRLLALTSRLKELAAELSAAAPY
jgi:hypothetical protein